jgi:hypothetical protein
VPQYAGEVRGGKWRLTGDARKRLNADLAKRKDGPVWMELHTAAQLRTLRQNAWWWGCVVREVARCWQQASGAELPHSPKTVHGALMRATFGTVSTPLGEERRSSTDLTTKEFTHLIDETRAYLLERFGVVVPNPDEWAGENGA